MKLIIDNSLCQLKDYTPEHYKSIRQLLSFNQETRGRFGQISFVRKYLIDRYGKFPTGLLGRVQKYFIENRITYTRVDNRNPPKPSRMPQDTLFIPGKYPTPYPEQIAAAEACKHAISGIVVSPTGTGKSLICALICDKIKVPTLIAVPSLELKRQTLSTLISYFGENMVGTLKDKKFIAVENYDALDPDKILEGYHGVIIDEFHHSGADTIRKLSLRAWKNVYYRYGLTATPIRANSEEQILLESVIAPIVYKLEYQTAVDKGYIVPVTAYFYQLPRIKCAAKNWKEVYSELVVNRKDRNKKIVNIIESLHDTGESVLVLVNEISHGKELQKLCEARGLNIPFANGQDDNSRIMILEFNLKETHILIGSSILGEGVDTKPCGWVIMAGGTGKSKVQIMQRIGRAIRNYPGKISGKILTFLDPSHKYLTNHHREYVKVLKQEYGIEPCKLGD